MDKMAGEGSLGGREHYYLDFSAQLDENIDKVSGCAGITLNNIHCSPIAWCIT